MKIISAEFVTSAASGASPTVSGGPRLEGIPHDGLLQVAVIGRSNVGKSTLLNALARRPIARTSAAPGKTRLANVFRLVLEGGGPGRWSLYLIDLPGYGYARGGADAGKELAAVAEGYFRGAGCGMRDAEPDGAHGAHRNPPSAALTLLLVDSRHPGLDSDLQAHGWLATLGVEPMIVATKVDKLSRAERTRNLRELERIFGKPALPVSAERGEGMEALWTTIASQARTAERRRKPGDE